MDQPTGRGPLNITASVKPMKIGIVDGQPIVHVEIKCAGVLAFALLMVEQQMNVPRQAVILELVEEALRARGYGFVLDGEGPRGDLADFD